MKLHRVKPSKWNVPVAYVFGRQMREDDITWRGCAVDRHKARSTGG